MRKRALLCVTVYGLIAASCSSRPTPDNGTSDSVTPTVGDDTPAWVTAMIASFQSQPVGNPPQSIYRYTYDGRTVYYVPPTCCDQLSTLYDVDGNVICAPDGGFSGKGDGRCPDFLEQATDKVLIWEDLRR
jgi:hypothetical protein